MEGSTSNHLLSVLLILVAFTSYINSTSAARPAAGKTTTDFIRTSCNSTIYPKLCFSSLSSYANTIQTDPKLLAHTALSVTLDTARSISTMMVKLSKTHGLKPREVSAMRDCVEELSDSVYELRKSLAKMGRIESSEFELNISDIQTWVSAAMTDEDTCTEGFAGKEMDGKMKTTVRKRIVNVAQLTSNALSLINSYAALHY